MICFDIETGALPWPQIQPLVPPFDELLAVPDPGDFDPASVKHGNTKDPEKRAAKESEARVLHEQMREQLPRLRAAARNEHVAKFTEKAALSATTGCVKAIGILDEQYGPLIWHAGGPDPVRIEGLMISPLATEPDMIAKFWDYFRGLGAETLVGWNIFGFDLPFLIRRSWMLGVDVPDSVRKGRYWHPQLVDAMEIWGCGSRDMVKLDAIDRALGGQGKPDDCTGADFARLFDNGGQDREAALRYLRNDLEMTLRVAEALQIL